MAGSTAEREIRDYCTDRLRAMFPNSRIVHELVVGQCRADLAVVQPEKLTLVEIKSKKDTLSRLKRQVKCFAAASHAVIVVAHEKWWDRTPYNNGRERFVPGDELSAAAARAQTWAYPEDSSRPMYGCWRVPNNIYCDPEPRAAEMLGLLWRDELLTEAFRHRISIGRRANMHDILREMVLLMTGLEIARAVCRQLRSRPFPEADAPIGADG